MRQCKVFVHDMEAGVLQETYDRQTLKSSDVASASLLVSSIVNWISSQLTIPSLKIL